MCNNRNMCNDRNKERKNKMINDNNMMDVKNMLSVDKYIISGYCGEYDDDKKWDLDKALKTGMLFIDDYVGLSGEIKKDDFVYFREYSNGLIGKASIDDVLLSNNIFQYTLKDIHLYESSLPQDELFSDISNDQRRSRIIRINNNDVILIEQKIIKHLDELSQYRINELTQYESLLLQKKV